MTSRRFQPPEPSPKRAAPPGAMPAPGTGVRGTQHDTPSAGDAAVDNVSEEFKLDLGCGLLLLARVELLGVTALPTGRRNQNRNEKMLHTRELMGAVLVAMHSRLGIGSKNPVVGRADAKRRLHQFAFANFKKAMDDEDFNVRSIPGPTTVTPEQIDDFVVRQTCMF